MGRSDYSGGQFLGHSFDSPQIAQWIARDRYLLLQEARRQFPCIVDFDTLARLLQPEIQDLIDLVHPFLPSRQIAHEQFYPRDEDPVSLQFLATVTSLVNNLSPAFQSAHWFAWKMTDPCFKPSDLFPGEVSVLSLGILSARRPWLRLTPTGAFKQGLNWFHFHMLSLAEDMTQKSYPEILDFSVIAYWSQPELASLIGLVHPFLCAHVQHFPHDTDPVTVRFLLSITITVNNLGPYFIDANWSCWMIRDELGSLFGPDDQFPGEFVAVGLNVIRLGSETLPSCINAAFKLLAPIQSAIFPTLVPEESIFHLNSYE
ncbi:hypothetical protein IW261DRAFT_1423550 [Armillaria novae-zelandiae]|uniref:Uncharacterized protein n=1 Tax=Armillaria novae-zelandiae TaxID=153914 RepID=A0AA39U8W7_9AGAR|nr:hypothetical protein IW261DRAFT_1423550 [Armillaria novae-zelandiae]